MFCKQCGTEIPVGASACPNCGKTVEVIMIAEEKKPESVATAAPVSQPTSEAASKKRRKSDNLILPVVMLAISGVGLVYFYISGTFGSIINWFTSESEKANIGRSELVTEMNPVELLSNIGVIVLSAILGLVAVIGLIILFKRLGRKFVRKD